MKSSIDATHLELLDKFHHQENEIVPNLISQKNEIRAKIRALSCDRIEDYMEYKDQLKSLNAQIKELKQGRTKYLLDNSKHLFNYFEDKQNISSGSTKRVNVLNSFFKIRDTTAETKENDKTSSKQSIIDYWKNVNNEITNLSEFVVPTDVCMSCCRGEMIPQDDDGVVICNNRECGVSVVYMTDSMKPTNNEPPNEVSYTAYIRLNHFKEILSQFQAKETTQIPEQVILDIRNRLKKERIKNIADELNYDKMRDILRKLGYNKYFEHIQYINSIFGIKPPIMNEALHETLCVLFIEIQKPWAVHCPANRTNFFNYTYTLFQLCVLLDQRQYLPYIQLMKDRDKQLEQDQIWCQVCKDLDWQYFPTV